MNKFNEQYEIRNRFENGEPLEFRRKGTAIWYPADWSKWEWDVFDYRIRPKVEMEEVRIVVVPLLSQGQVVWLTEEMAKRVIAAGNAEYIDKFRTYVGKRCAYVTRKKVA